MYLRPWVSSLSVPCVVGCCAPGIYQVASRWRSTRTIYYAGIYLPSTPMRQRKGIEYVCGRSSLGVITFSSQLAPSCAVECCGRLKSTAGPCDSRLAFCATIAAAVRHQRSSIGLLRGGLVSLEYVPCGKAKSAFRLSNIRQWPKGAK